jgi:hypothetical protein
VRSTHAVGDGMHGAIVQATKPLDWTPDRVHPVDLPRPVAGLAVLDGAGCCGGTGCC